MFQTLFFNTSQLFREIASLAEKCLATSEQASSRFVWTLSYRSGHNLHVAIVEDAESHDCGQPGKKTFHKWMVYEDRGWRDGTPTMPSFGLESKCRARAWELEW
jgi:hypothetical protein